MRAAAIFQLSWPSDRIGTSRYATTVPTVVATVKLMQVKKSESVVGLFYRIRVRQIAYEISICKLRLKMNFFEM